ncbi:MAG: hypothetical protein JWO96_58 [Candidatus Saccharibacteria bacterium]|nr:hypothetical protein [Candidatus Saccharibacteria bacterium]
MAATNTSNKPFEAFIDKLRSDYPQFNFRPGRQTRWSPRDKTVIYNSSEISQKLKSGLLHELAHGLLGHSTYNSDFELLKMESEAWTTAAELGRKYGVKISDDYIQTCLDTYRDWLHRRSTCPTCGTHVMQKDATNYQCYNCQTAWEVTGARFLRPYRKSLKNTKTR